MGLVLFGGAVGIASTAICVILGDITLGEAALIYWLTGTAAPILHVGLGVTTPAVAR